MEIITYISILRGINVGGQKKVRMEDLRKVYEDLGFRDVQSYIQSGNVIFTAGLKTSDQQLAATIEKGVKEKFGFDVPVIIRTSDEMKNIIEANPFLNKENIDKEKLHVTFLADIPEQAKLNNIEMDDYSPDRFIVLNREVFLYCPGGYGKTKLSNTFFERKLNVKATTRSWKTVNKLMVLAGVYKQ